MTVWFEPTDTHRAFKPFYTDRWQNITYISPNMNELRQIYAGITGKKEITMKEGCSCNSLADLIDECLTLCNPIMQHIHCAVVTLDAKGVLIVRNSPSNQKLPLKLKKEKGEIKSVVHYSAPQVNIRNVSGAGDCLAGTMIAAIIRKHEQDDCVLAGLKAASLSLVSQTTVPNTILTENIFNTDKDKLSAQFERKIIL